MEQHKLVTEGAGAVAVAAAMFNKVDIKGKKVVCLLSGGNIDVTILSRVIKRGNVISVHHERANEGSDVNGCYLRLVLETKNYEHIEEIKKALIDFGFIVYVFFILPLELPLALIVADVVPVLP